MITLDWTVLVAYFVLMVPAGFFSHTMAMVATRTRSRR